ncbi:MAG: diaminopimelate decarboxylase [archaeon]
MSHTPIPFTKKEILELIKSFPTPFHIYDEERIRQTAKSLNKAFSWVKGFKNYFAVKALPNPSILKILKEEGMGADCSSLPELMLSNTAGMKNEEIMFTSNDTPQEEFQKAHQLNAIINLDDISHLEFLEKTLGKMPELICFRYNPGLLRGGNEILGNPVESKYGLTNDQIVEAYKKAKELGVKRFGLHTMIVSNMRDEEYLIKTAEMLFSLALKIYKQTGIKIEFVNLGGGIGIPYSPEDKKVDLDKFSKGVKESYDKIIKGTALEPLRIVMESGRAITGPHGWLISRVRHVSHKYRDYVGLDACMANLMRPALYGAYHEITVLGKENSSKNFVYDVTGSLCENNDKFAIQRKLPKIVPGDIIVIHNTGAHGHAMGFNYNGKLRSAEFLRKTNGKFIMIRRAETVKDYFATLSGFDASSGFTPR